MARTPKRKTQRANYTPESIHAAVMRVRQHGEKIRKVADDSGIDKSTLSRYVKKYADGIPVKCGYWGNRRVFSDDQEIELVNYLVTSCKMYYGLTPLEVKNWLMNWPSKMTTPCLITGRITVWQVRTGLVDS